MPISEEHLQRQCTDLYTEVKDALLKWAGSKILVGWFSGVLVILSSSVPPKNTDLSHAWIRTVGHRFTAPLGEYLIDCV